MEVEDNWYEEAEADAVEHEADDVVPVRVVYVAA